MKDDIQQIEGVVCSPLICHGHIPIKEGSSWGFQSLTVSKRLQEWQFKVDCLLKKFLSHGGN